MSLKDIVDVVFDLSDPKKRDNLLRFLKKIQTWGSSRLGSVGIAFISLVLMAWTLNAILAIPFLEFKKWGVYILIALIYAITFFGLLRLVKKFQAALLVGAIIFILTISLLYLFAREPLIEVLSAPTSTPTATETPTVTITPSVTFRPPTITPSIIPSDTPTATCTTTPTSTQIPTLTTPPTPIPTPTPTPFPGEFQKGCIPSPWIGVDLIPTEDKLVRVDLPYKEDGCVDLKGVGIGPEDDKILLFVEARDYSAFERQYLVFPITEGIKSISFKLKLKEMVPASPSRGGSPTTVFFGVGAPDETGVPGEYILFDKSSGEDKVFSSYIKGHAPQLYFPRRNPTEYNDYDIIEIELGFEPPGFYLYENGEHGGMISTVDIANPAFIIGYSVPPGGGRLSCEIFDFIIRYE